MILLSLMPRRSLDAARTEALANRILSPDEIDCWLRLPGDARRSEWLDGRLAAKLNLRRFLQDQGLGSRLREIEVLPRDGVPWVWVAGIPPPHLSISHCSCLVATAVSPDSAIGVDIEPIRSRHPAVARYFLRAAERDLVQSFLGGGSAALTGLWTLKEAALKACSLGLQVPPSCVEVGFDQRLRITLHAPLASRWCVRTACVRRIGDHVMAVAAAEPAKDSVSSSTS